MTNNPLAIVNNITNAAHKLQELEQLAIIYGCALHDRWDELRDFELHDHPAAIRLRTALNRPLSNLTIQTISHWWHSEVTRLINGDSDND